MLKELLRCLGQGTRAFKEFAVNLRNVRAYLNEAQSQARKAGGKKKEKKSNAVKLGERRRGTSDGEGRGEREERGTL